MLLVSENTSMEGLRATKESLPVTEEATVNTDPKIPPKSSHLETVGPFSFLDYFLLLVFTVILKYWEINTD